MAEREIDYPSSHSSMHENAIDDDVGASVDLNIDIDVEPSWGSLDELPSVCEMPLADVDEIEASDVLEKESGFTNHGANVDISLNGKEDSIVHVSRNEELNQAVMDSSKNDVADNLEISSTDGSSEIIIDENAIDRGVIETEAFVRDINPVYRKRYLEQTSPQTKKRTKKVQKFILGMLQPNNTKPLIDSTSVSSSRNVDQSEGFTPAHLLEEMRNSRAMLELYEQLFPRSIWRCCSSVCFFLNMSNPQLVNKLAKICQTAREIRQSIGKSKELIAPRRNAIGCSTIGFAEPSRSKKEMENGRLGTPRQAAQQKLVEFAKKVTPFLRRNIQEPQNALRLEHKLCINAVCSILGVSRTFLYGIRKRSFVTPGESRHVDNASAKISIIDSAGVREREFRRIGLRAGFPSLEEMREFDCGCAEPCFARVPLFQIERSYQDFIEISTSDENRRRRENQFLLNKMFYPLSNSTTWQCDRSIANLFTVSESLVREVRQTLKRMCEDPALQNRPLQDGWRKNGYSSNYHPANRMSDEMRERIENHLHMVLRPDPAGWKEVGVCRVYSPEINTHEKLCKLLVTLLDSDEGVQRPVTASSSTLHRRIKEYLQSRSLRIAYEQTDHNACPTCKTLKYATFQYFKEYKHMEKTEQHLVRQAEKEFSDEKQKEIDTLRVRISDKKNQEAEALNEYRTHCQRDRDIRGAIKRMSDKFRATENDLIRDKSFARRTPSWCSLENHAILTHQDDMTKVDLPYFVESASADITRWRFGVNAHVSSVNGDAVVFSHEQGTGSKTAASIFEEVLLDHIVRCRGEAIKVIVSDNASVGKNWVTTIALPQYLVDQGLASIALVVFLENNHGKWLADMLFGQLQTRRKKTMLLSVDDLLSEFEAVNRKTGTTQGFVLNPLSSIDFTEVLYSLGYETKPPKGFNFPKRNIHFAAAAAPGAKNRLSSDLRKLLDPALPDDQGVVRICSDPPREVPQSSLPYEERYFDVPAARTSLTRINENVLSRQYLISTSDPVLTQGTSGDSERINRAPGDIQSRSAEVNATRGGIDTQQRAGVVTEVPLVVPLNMGYVKSGNCVVPSRTAKNVGFNGLSFRNKPAFPELRNTESDIVRRAWPAGLVDFKNHEREDPQNVSERLKCAPENWVMRRPILRQISHLKQLLARYPPRNLLNSQFNQGPRSEFKWVPTSTYPELPFPVIEGTCAFAGIQRLARRHNDILQSVHTLDLLKAIFEEMGRTEGESCDMWLQRSVTLASPACIEQYRKEMDLYIRRQDGHPKAPLTVKQAFKQDQEILAKVNHALSQKNSERNGTSKTKELSRLFEEAERTPGFLDRFEYIVERDLERFSRELRTFKDKQQTFDEKEGLLPN